MAGRASQITSICTADTLLVLTLLGATLGTAENRALVRIPETHPTPSHTLIAIRGKAQNRPVVSLKSYFPCSLLMGSVTDIREDYLPSKFN